VSGSLFRRLPRVLAATLAVAAMLVAPVAASPVAAADDDGLSLSSSSTYTLVPDRGLVHVTVAMTAENTKPNLVRETPNGTITTRYFFENASLAIHAEAANVVAKAGDATLRTRTAPDEGFTVLRVDFPRDLYFEETQAFTVDFDLPGGAPRSESDIRVGSAFATFYAWAFGDGGEVRIEIPGGYDVEASGSPTRETAEGGVTTIAATGIDDTAEWYTVVVADRHDALTEDRLDLPGGESLVIRAWPEDQEWRTRVRDLLDVGLPVLAAKVGLEWPVEGDMEVAEVHTPLLEGYAGLFYTEEERIEISEDLDELTIIHEASHAWFNERLFVGRWIGEGLADEYASRVLDEVSVGGLAPEPVNRQSPGAVALNDWQSPGRIDDEETNQRESYGYQASWSVMRALMDEVGEAGMQAVVGAAHEKLTAYVGAGEAETISYTNDWRRFLDLLEERGGSTRAAAIFRQWILTDDEKPLLEERAAARAAYAELVAAGDGWLPGYAVRDPMGRWQFVRAHSAIEDAAEVLWVRDQLEDAAKDAGLLPPPSLRLAYESADGHFERALALAEDQLALAREIGEAAAGVAAGRDPITAIGLLGADPEAGVERAREAFDKDAPENAQAEIDAVEAALAGAGEAGRSRVVVGGLGLIAVIGVGGMLTLDARGRRRVVATGSAWSAGTDPYATLGAPRQAAAEPKAPDVVDREGGEGT
jgi:hypothetical protein